MGKNEFLDGIVKLAKWARTNDNPPLSPPHLVPHSDEKVKEEEEGRDLDRDFSEKVRNDPEWIQKGTAFHPSPSLTRSHFIRLAYFSCLHVCDTVTCKTHAFMQNDHFHPALNCVPCRYAYCAFNGPCATRYTRGMQILIITARKKRHTRAYTRYRFFIHGGWVINSDDARKAIVFRACDCIRLRIIAMRAITTDTRYFL